jgi:hypothetical protein
MAGRLALALEKLREQVDGAYLGRKKDSDGWSASAAHHQQNPSSDHEADSRGIVHALDLTHDPERFDSYGFADWLISQRDARIKYVISNRRIAGDEGYARRNNRVAWRWYPYHGTSPHTEHVHISVNRDGEDDERAWTLPAEGDVRPYRGAGEAGEAGDEMFVAEASGKGSWFSQFQGQYNWHDDGDTPNSNKLGVPDNRQGFAMYSNATLGKWRDVRAPNGVVLRLQQTDIGPNPATGRTIDIAAVAAEHFGYSPKNFPTDSVFQWSAVVARDAPTQLQKETGVHSAEVAELQRLLGFDPASEIDGYFSDATDKAVRHFQRREGLTVDGVAGPATMSALNAKSPDIFALLNQLREKLMASVPTTPVAPLPVDPKSWLQSKTIWGVLIAAAPAVISAIGPALGVAIPAGEASQLVQTAVTLVGSVLAIYGRTVASQPLK